MTTDAKVLTLQLFPLSPEAVRRLRMPREVADTAEVTPSQNDQTATHRMSCPA